MQEHRRTRLTDTKLLVEIVVGILVIASGIIGFIKLLHPFSDSPDARLSVVESTLITSGSYPRLQLKIRNRSAAVALLKRAELQLADATVDEEHAHFATNIQPTFYNWMLTEADVRRGVSIYPLTRKIEGNDADNLEFTFSFERLKAAVTTTATLRVFYNESDSIVLGGLRLRIVNSGGRVPALFVNTTSEDLYNQLLQSDVAYTIRELIGELARRRYDPAAAGIQGFLASDNPSIRRSAAAFFSSVRFGAACGALVHATHDGEAGVRDGAYQALRTQQALCMADIAELSKDPSPVIRSLSIGLAAHVPGIVSEGLLTYALRDRAVCKVLDGHNILVSAVAVDALAKLNTNLLRSRLEEILSDSDWSMKLAGVRAAGTMNAVSARKSLLAIAREGDSTFIVVPGFQTRQ